MPLPGFPKKIDIESLEDHELQNVDLVIKKLVERERGRLNDGQAHVNDHSSSHNSKPS